MKNNYKLFIANIYHCSEEWGQQMTEEDMKTALENWKAEFESDEYVPAVSLYKKCAAFWNELCIAYPA